MTFVSITRLRIRSLRFLPSFALHTRGTIAQVRAAPGFITGALLPERWRIFWTMTLWNEERDMRAYMASGAHLKAMPKLLHWCDEASVVHWHQADQTPPDWIGAARRMRSEGRPSKLRHPAPDQVRLGFRDPDPRRSMPLAPTPAKL